MSENKSSMKTVFLSVIGAVVGSIIAAHFFSGGSVKFEKQLLNASNELNKNCPMIIDKETRLDTSVGGPGKKFTYFYTLINYSSADAVGISKEKFEGAIKPNLVNNIRTNKNLKLFRDMEVEMIYTYRTNDNKEFARISVKPQEYL